MDTFKIVALRISSKELNETWTDVSKCYSEDPLDAEFSINSYKLSYWYYGYSKYSLKDIISFCDYIFEEDGIKYDIKYKTIEISI